MAPPLNCRICASQVRAPPPPATQLSRSANCVADRCAAPVYLRLARRAGMPGCGFRCFGFCPTASAYPLCADTRRRYIFAAAMPNHNAVAKDNIWKVRWPQSRVPLAAIELTARRRATVRRSSPFLTSGPGTGAGSRAFTPRLACVPRSVVCQVACLVPRSPPSPLQLGETQRLRRTMKLQDLASSRGTSYSRSFGRTALLQTKRASSLLAVESPARSPVAALPTLSTIACTNQPSPSSFHLTTAHVASRRAGLSLDIFGASPYARGRVDVDKALGIPKEAFP